ncbi:MAG: SRPBCC domain-containing protein [Chloroflexota bacterium]|nr:SRPBCC domain-containing protein [Chloroflexota bacterium]
MPDIVIERTIAATPESVFNALTQQDEIVRWWANEAQVKPEVGSLGEFRFRQPAGVLQFEVAELTTGEKVRWLSRQGPPQWAGTSVTWNLTPVQNGTRLLFTHAGFAQVDKAYEQVRGNWEYFLDSLKSYLETGKGTPGFPAFL